jgi:hypothetical protein
MTDPNDERGQPGGPPLWSIRRWFAAMGFPLIILAAVFAWEGYGWSTGRKGPVDQGRVTLCYAGAAVCFALGVAAVRARHRRGRG